MVSERILLRKQKPGPKLRRLIISSLVFQTAISLAEHDSTTALLQKCNRCRGNHFTNDCHEAQRGKKIFLEKSHFAKVMEMATKFEMYESAIRDESRLNYAHEVRM